MSETKELKPGETVTINIPFTYTIGDEGYYSDKTLKTIEDCKLEVIEELKNNVLEPDNILLTED